MDPRISELALSQLMERRTIMLNAPIDNAVSSAIIAQLLLVDGLGSDPVQMLVSSPGGSFAASFAIIDTMAEIDADVITIGNGAVAGTAVMIVAAGAPGRRVALPHSRFQLEPIKPDREYQVEELAEFVRFRKECYERFAGLTGRTWEEIEADCEKLRAFDAREALEYGIVDEVREKKG